MTDASTSDTARATMPAETLTTETLAAAVREQLLALAARTLPAFSGDEVERWMSAAETTEALAILVGIAADPADTAAARQRLNALADAMGISLVLAVADRLCRPALGYVNVSEILSGTARDKFIASVTYVLSAVFRPAWPEGADPAWAYIEDALCYFLTEQLAPQLVRWRDECPTS